MKNPLSPVFGKMIRKYPAALVLALAPGMWMEARALDVDQYPALQDLVAVMSSEDGYPREELVEILGNVSIDEKVLSLMDRQYEALPWFKYRKLLINQKRIEDGVRFQDQNEAVLDRAFQEYGVPPAVIAALIGIETHYGTRMGDRSVLASLVTLSAAYPRRSRFFTHELRTFLNTTRKEKIDPATVQGSFAGAIGIPQFMPTSYEAWAVDFNGNGRRDLVNELDDAIGSVARYLQGHNWTRGERIYADVISPLSESAASLVGKRAKLIHKTSALVDAGVRFDASGGSVKSALFHLDDENGKRYVVGFRNFYAITRYNHSINYALAVAELSEEIARRRRQ